METWRRMKAGKSVKVCGDAGFRRTVSVGQFFVTRSTVALKDLGVRSSCRQYTHPRDDAESYPKAAIGNDTKIGAALDVVFPSSTNGSKSKSKLMP